VNVASPAAGDISHMPPEDASKRHPSPSRRPSPAGRVLRVLVTVVVAGGLVVAAATWQTHQIEGDLTARAQAALTLAGIPVTVHYDGLDAVLTGSVTRPQQGADAIGAVVGVTGTRHVTSRLTVVTGEGTTGTGGSASPTPAPTSTAQPGTGTAPSPLPVGKITFATNDATLSPAAKAYLDQVATFLQEHPDLQLAVRGHSDNSGTDEINWSLSKQRAAVVVAYLVGRQVPAARLHPAAFAATSPVATNDTPDGRAANRRVELAIVEAP
jgi:outer membrane protein OmpA-like peptidoglycan-associated protein